MELKGTIKEILQVQSGQSKSGSEWRKQQFILETLDDKYPKTVCIMVWGDNIDKFALQVGLQVEASIEIESREFNQRWYTDVKAWKVEILREAQKEDSNLF